MRIVNSSELGSIDLEGERGKVKVIDFLNDEQIVFGLRIAGPATCLPKKIHRHPMRQAMYIISGSGKVDNGKEIREFHEGDFMYFDKNEEPYFDSCSGDLAMVEVQFP
jgi:mannose-6-phosphate isomerase-like protein (cupin superfamily)